jgi:hypothetical protein
MRAARGAAESVLDGFAADLIAVLSRGRRRWTPEAHSEAVMKLGVIALFAFVSISLGMLGSCGTEEPSSAPELASSSAALESKGGDENAPASCLSTCTTECVAQNCAGLSGAELQQCADSCNEGCRCGCGLYCP